MFTNSRLQKIHEMNSIRNSKTKFEQTKNKGTRFNDDDDCQLISIAKITPPEIPPAPKPIYPHHHPTIEKNDSDDDVKLIKIERIRKPTIIESQLKLPPKVAETFFKATPQPDPKDDPLEVNKTFSCSQCKRSFSSGQHLMNHIKTHEKSHKTTQKPKTTVKQTDGFNCAYCEMSFEKQVSLAAHMNAHKHQVERKEVKCKTCGEFFKSNGSLWNHRKNVHKPELHKCQLCSKTFAKKIFYDAHLRKHEEQPAILCNVCGKTFTIQNTLKIHLRIHSGERPFLCSECGKSFTTNTRLKEHLARHKGERKHSCTICQKQFYEKTELKKHSYVHSSSADKPHKCEFCGKGFIFPASMRQHILIHTGEKPFKCNFDESCQRHFRNQSQMKRHVRGAHKGIYQFICDICGRAFLDKQNLEGHLKRLHSVRHDGYACTEENCFMEFKTVKELNEHQKKHYIIYEFQ